MTENPTTPDRTPPAQMSAPAPAPSVRVARIVRLPSPRGTAVLAGAMLALGVAIGAAIGPAPNTSFAGGARLLLPSLGALAGTGTQTASTSTPPPPVTSQASPAPASASSTPTASSRTSLSAGASEGASRQPAPSSSAPTSAGGGSEKALPPTSHVWLIELSGTSFSDALAAPSAAPYIDAQAVPAGTLLSGWSALDASAFASDAGLIAGTAPQLLDTIVQPPCPEASGVQCTGGTPGGLTAADEFLKATIPTITPTAAYRTNGLIVVTFASVLSASDTGLPSGVSNATLTSEPPSGALLISPFASAGARPTAISFNPASPRQSLEKLLHQ